MGFLAIMTPNLSKILIRAREERDYLLSRPYVPREGLAEFRDSLRGNMVAVITGPRRAGKSVFALSALSGAEFIYVNFEDDQLEGVSAENILQAAISVYGPLPTLFFDEIHRCPGWETFITRLHRRGYRCILTGSNAHLLGRELATALTGRYFTHQVLPFGFEEYCTARGLVLDASQPGTAMHALREYLDTGGYPEPVTSNMDSHGYVGTLFDAVLYKDILVRHRVRFPRQLSDVALLFASAPGGEYTYNAISRLGAGISVPTVQKYAGYLEEANLFFSLPSFSFSARKRLKSARKAYPVDTTFLSARGGRFTHEWGRLLETAVFLELVRRGYQPGQSLFFYKTKRNREVDFVLKRGLEVEKIIQVCWDCTSGTTMDRECRALVEASNELGGSPAEIVTMDRNEPITVKGAAISCRPAWEWLSSRPEIQA